MGIRVNPGKHGKYHNTVGKFIPIHPEKIENKPNVLIYKSNLEYRLMMYLDHNPNILSWSYEKFAIKYRDDSSNGKVRNYWIDFVATVKQNETKNQRVWIEVKSAREVNEPKKDNIREHTAWIKNQSKWKAAKLLAEAKGYKFIILTEDVLK